MRQNKGLEHFQAKWTPVRVKKMRQNKDLEHFQAKWTPVRVKKMRQNKDLEHFCDSMKRRNALASSGFSRDVALLKKYTKRVGNLVRRARGDGTNVTGCLVGHFEALFIDHAIFRTVYVNLHQISKQAWRSAQPGPAHIRRLKRLGIRTIINLRGERDCATYLFEKAACAKAGITLIDFIMTSREPPSREQVHGAAALFRQIDYPVLFHCKSGADRAGIMSALYLHLQDGRPVAEAAKQLSLRYGHVRHARTGVLDYFFARYLADRRQQDISFLDWVDQIYDKKALTTDFRSSLVGGFVVDRLLKRE